MGRLILNRLLGIIPIMLLVSFGVTSLVQLIPGDAAVKLAGGENAQPAKIQEIREQLHLDDPLLVQYGRWLGNAVRGNFGNSLQSGLPIASGLPSRILVTSQLILMTLLFVLIIVAVIGAVSSLRPGSLLERVLLSLTNVAIAAPAFLVGIALIIVFSVRFKVFPSFGYVPFTDNPVEWARHMILPAAALSALTGAMVARQLQAGLSDTMDASYVRTAWAKGGSTTRVMTRHVLRNSSMPALTVLGLQIGLLLGGAVITESIFNLPGLGTYLLEAINFQDLPVIQAVAVFFVFVRMIANLVVDVLYGVLDPRVRT